MDQQKRIPSVANGRTRPSGLACKVLLALCGSRLGKNTRGGTIIVGALNLGGSIRVDSECNQYRRTRHRQKGLDVTDAGRRAPTVEMTCLTISEPGSASSCTRAPLTLFSRRWCRKADCLQIAVDRRGLQSNV